MKQYESQIAKAKEQAAAFKAGNKGHSAQELNKKIGRLETAISRNDEVKAGLAAAALGEFADGSEEETDQTPSNKKK